MDQVFFRQLKTTEDQQVSGLREFKEVEDSFRVGYDSVGFEILVRTLGMFDALNLKTTTIFQIENMLSDDSVLAAKSLNHLCDELKNPIKTVQALKNGILEILITLLSDLKYYVHPCIMQNSLQLLQLLCENFDASKKIAANKTLTDVLINLTFDKELSLLAANVLISLSSNTNG
jgi:hypothetical protein